eukprot:gene4400-3876_t
MPGILGPNRVLHGRHYAGTPLGDLGLVPPRVRRPVEAGRAADAAFRQCLGHGLDCGAATAVAAAVAVEVRPYIDHELMRQYGRLLRLRQQLPLPLALTVFDKRNDQWGCACRHHAREVYREHFSDSKYYADVSATHGARAERFYGFRAGPPRSYVILKW